MTFLVGTLAASKITVTTPWQGPWYVDAEVTLEDGDVPPTGSTTVTVGGATLVGTVDPRASGRMGATAFVRVVAGAGGWDKAAPALEFHNDAGVTSTVVMQATASAVGETVVDASPVVLGPDWVRVAGVASRALGARAWYVDAAGVTQVGPRPPVAPAPDDLQVFGWDPVGEIVELGTDTLLVPGLSLTDDRWDGAIILRDIEQVFEAAGSKVSAACSVSSVSRAQEVFRNLVVETSGVAYARRYRFRVVSQGSDGRLTLQAMAKAPGAPDSQLITPWYGVPGLSAKVAPGCVVHGVFIEGDPSIFVVVGFDATVPLEVDLAAATLFKIGAPVTQAHGTTPVALAPPLASIVSALETFIAAVAAYAGGIQTTADPSKAATPTLATAATNAAAALVAAAAQIPSLTLQAG